MHPRFELTDVSLDAPGTNPEDGSVKVASFNANGNRRMRALFLSDRGDRTADVDPTGWGVVDGHPVMNVTVTCESWSYPDERTEVLHRSVTVLRCAVTGSPDDVLVVPVSAGQVSATLRCVGVRELD